MLVQTVLAGVSKNLYSDPKLSAGSTMTAMENSLPSYVHRDFGAVQGVRLNRRRVTPVTAPALSRHVAVWLPRKDGSTRREHFDGLIRSIYIALKVNPSIVRDLETNSTDTETGELVLFSGRVESHPPFDVSEERQYDTQRAIKLFFTLDTVDFVVAFNLHEEVATITLTADCSLRPKTRDAQGKLSRLVLGALEKLERREQWPNKETNEASDFLYFLFWEMVDEAILKDEGFLGLGPLLVDARGLILGPEAFSEDKKTISLAKPFIRERTTDAAAPARVGAEASSLDAHHISAVLPLLTCQAHRSVEYTLSYFMGKRAIYASCLGGGPDLLEERVVKPITFLLLADAFNSWQLGRLIYRIQRASVSRIAATVHFHPLRKVGNALRIVERTLEDALSKASSSKTTDPKTLDSLREQARESYVAVETTLDKELEYGAGEALTYRVERSRYYVRHFHRSVKALRVERVEGFQPYDEFVEQRQGSAFELIDLIGRRYERIQSDRSLLLRRIQVFDSETRESEISDAQSTADIALFIVLGPYYAAQLITHAFFRWLGNPSEFVAQLAWLCCFVFGVAIFLVKGARLDTVRRRRRTIVCVILVLGLISVFVAQAVVSEAASDDNQHKDLSAAHPQ